VRNRGTLDQTEKTDVEEILAYFSRTAEGVWAVDDEQRIVLWNAAAERLLGYPADQVAGQICHELLSGQDPRGQPVCRSDCPIMDRARRGQLPESFSMQVRRNDGGATWIDTSIIVLPEESGKEGSAAVVHLFRQVGERTPLCPPLRIHLLGCIVVERADGSRVVGPLWRRAKVRALLAILALRQGHPVRRDELVEALWPDLDYPAALHNLNSTVYDLRRSLEPALERATDSYIDYEGGSYTLNSGEAHWLDVEAFEAGIAHARREPEPTQAMSRYQEALDLYRGEFLADIEPGILLCDMKRQWLRELYLTTSEELAAIYVKQRQEGEAMALYLKAQALDPCRETVARSLMRLALDRRDRATAVAYYRRLERALWRELEILPSQETSLLYDMAVRGD